MKLGCESDDKVSQGETPELVVEKITKYAEKEMTIKQSQITDFFKSQK